LDIPLIVQPLLIDGYVPVKSILRGGNGLYLLLLLDLWEQSNNLKRVMKMRWIWVPGEAAHGKTAQRHRQLSLSR
jgi:hypothetical protein